MYNNFNLRDYIGVDHWQFILYYDKTLYPTSDTFYN